MKLIRVIDFETTGIDAGRHRVVEVGIVDLELDDSDADGLLPSLRRVGLWWTTINPQMPIPPEASGIHDITDDMVADAPTLGDVAGRLIEGPPDAYCAHNSRFDSTFYRPQNIPWIDTYRLALWLWPDAPDHKLGTLRYFLKLKLAPPADLKWRSHSAGWDAYVCAAILRQCFMQGASWQQMLDVSSEPALLRHFGFGKHAMVPIAEIDDGYLEWILKQSDMHEDIRHTALTELQRRRDGS